MKGQVKIGIMSPDSVLCPQIPDPGHLPRNGKNERGLMAIKRISKNQDHREERSESEKEDPSLIHVTLEEDSS